MDYISNTIEQLEEQQARIANALELLRALNGARAVATPSSDTSTKRRVRKSSRRMRMRVMAIGGAPTLQDIVLDAVGHGNHDFPSVYSWIRKHNGLEGRRKSSIGPALAALAVKKKLVRLSPGVYHIAPSSTGQSTEGETK